MFKIIIIIIIIIMFKTECLVGQNNKIHTLKKEKKRVLKNNVAKILLQRASLWLPLRAIRGNFLPSISFHYISHLSPVPVADHLAHLQLITWAI